MTAAVAAGGSEVRRARPLLGTLVEVSARAASARAANRAVERAFAAIAAVERSMSFHDPASELSWLNRARVGAWVPLSIPLRQVLRWADRFRRLSDGRFDCACGSVLVQAGRLPSPVAGPAAPVLPGAASDGSASFRMAGNGVIKLAPAWIDLGGIAKGYAVDCALAALRRENVSSALVNAGGDLAHLGPEPVEVDVRCLEDPTRIEARVRVQNAALATSSTLTLGPDLTRGGASLIDRGQPVTAARTVTVVAASCLVADGLTKVALAAPRMPSRRLLGRLGARVLVEQRTTRDPAKV